MRRILPFFAACAVSVTTLSAQSSAALKPYIYSDDGFLISSPVQPEVKKTVEKLDSGASVFNSAYSVDLGNDTAFLIWVTDMRSLNLDPARAIPGARDGFLKKLDAQMVSQKTIVIGGNSGLEFMFSTKDYHGRSQMFLSKGYLFQLSSIAPTGRDLPAAIDGMYESFRLLEGAR